MRISIIVLLAVLSAGCSSRVAMDRYLDSAYEHYDRGDCNQVLLALSQAERRSHPQDGLQPEISLLRGLCLERQGLFVDAVATYRFLLARYPTSEYGYRGRARLETLRQLGHYKPDEAVWVQAAKR